MASAQPKTYRSITGCCICKAKSSSSRFTSSARYESDFERCFVLEEGDKRTGQICNACVLVVKRFRKRPADDNKNWAYVVDARMGPGLKSIHKFKNRHLKNSSTPKEFESNSSTPVSNSPWMPTASLLSAANERLQEISMESASALAMLSLDKSAGKRLKCLDRQLDHRRTKGTVKGNIKCGLDNEISHMRGLVGRRRLILLRRKPQQKVFQSRSCIDLINDECFNRLPLCCGTAWTLSCNPRIVCIDSSSFSCLSAHQKGCCSKVKIVNKHEVDADDRDMDLQSCTDDKVKCDGEQNENYSEDIGNSITKDSQPAKSVVHVTKIIPRPIDWHLTAKSAKLGVVQTFSMPALINAMM